MSHVEVEYAVPESAAEEREACEEGDHEHSMRRVVHGWVGFNECERWYCACGTRLIVRMNGRSNVPYMGNPGDHLGWIESQRRYEKIAVESERR